MSVMVTLTKQQVPDYLVGSDFYNSLSGDDEEEFAIPSEYFKPTSAVTNAIELSHFMKTIKFWDLKRLPFEIIELLVFKSIPLLDSEPEVVCKILMELDDDFDLLELYLTVPVSTSKKQRLDAAVQCGREYVLEYIRTVDNQANRTMVKAAAENGHIHLLERVVHDLSHTVGNPFTYVSLSTVASRGHVDCVRYLFDRGCSVNNKVGLAAAQNGQLECLKLAHEHGYVLNRHTLEAVSSHGHLTCLKYCLAHGCSATASAASAAAAGGQVECLRCLLDHGAPLSTHLCNSAASSGSLPCLKLLRARDCPWDKMCPKMAAKNGNLSCLRFIFNSFGPYTELAAYNAAIYGKHHCLAYLLERGCKLYKDSVDEAAKRGHLRCLHILKRFEVPSDKNDVLAAIRRLDGDAYIRLLVRAHYELPSFAVICAINCTNVDCLEFICANRCCELTASLANVAASKPDGKILLEVLHRHECPWNEETCIRAASAETEDALAFAHTHGCLWDERVCLQAIQSDRMSCLVYACNHDCSCSVTACVTAAQCGQCDMLQLLHEQGLPMTQEVCVAAAAHNHADCLQYAVTHGCIWDAAISTAAAREGAESTLAYAVWHGCPCTIETCIAAAEAGSQPCLHLLHEHHCPWDERVSEAAAQSKDPSVLCYCVEHGCPLNKNTMKEYNLQRKYAKPACVSCYDDHVVYQSW